MSLLRLTRCLASLARILPGRLSTNLRKHSKPRRSRSESTLSSSNAVEVDKQKSAEGVLLNFYRLLNDATTSTHPLAFMKLHAAAGAAMRQCLQCGSADEALAVYHTLCSCGLVEQASLPVEGNAAEGQLSLEKMALEALRCIPHRVRRGAVVSQFVVAEAREKLIKGHWQSYSPGSSSTRRPPSPAAAEAATFAFNITKGGKISEVERFRIDLHRNIQLLCTSKYSQLQIGRNFLLRKLYDIGVSARLQAEIEIQPMCLLSGGVLWHPFAYATPTMPWAQRLSHFDDLGPFPDSIKTLSEAQMEGLEAVWESTASLRQLSRNTLMFLTSLATEWDQIFLRRVAETLILPDQAHNVFPTSYNRPQTSPSTARHESTNETDKVDAQGKKHLPSRTKWTDPAYELFTSVAMNSLEAALRRAEIIVKRRFHHGIVVPDALYILLYSNQLQQMGRHREIVLTHGVLLDLLHVALHHCDPRRFNARRVLRAFMLATTTSLTKRNFSNSRHASTMPFYQMHDGGVTVLGLQDELALLDGCPERFYVGESGLAGDALGGLAYSQALQRAGQQTHSLGHLSAVLVAKQLERMVNIHRKGLSFVTAMRSDSETQKMGLSQFVDDIVNCTFPQIPETEDCENQRPQLFKNQPRSYWSRSSVVVATTSANTRSLAFTLGINTFPPISAS
ncbi:unnamed protein product [Phytomonas sp. EM1]|nr:unnamed protein product [Phytomonas sp. EM1]|eukprot:CCW62017.1 unnamed protein product [Phytomonas sp. isolate EM1]